METNGNSGMDKSKEFSFEDNLPKNPGNNSGLPDTPKDKKFTGMSTLNLAHLLGKETLNWVRGDMDGKPQELKQLGEDFSQKLNWYIGCLILAQYSRIPALFDTLNEVSEKLFDTDSIKDLDTKSLVDMYNGLSKEIAQVAEFARRYVVQNKDFLADNSNFFDRSLFEKIKSLPMDLVKDYLTLFTIIERKGHQTLKDILEQYK